MEKFLVTYIALTLVYLATIVGRKKESDIPLFSWNTVLQILLISVGFILYHIAIEFL